MTLPFGECRRWSCWKNDGSQLVLTIGEDIARTGEAFCDDPISPDVLTETPYKNALEWLNMVI
ncbi:MAG: hypothetical protein IJM12_00235 [Bacteroidales bacterium]|nr:hypothetical protein [Bacteroidales bacterium]